jgi:hypothetical protein
LIAEWGKRYDYTLILNNAVPSKIITAYIAAETDILSVSADGNEISMDIILSNKKVFNDIEYPHFDLDNISFFAKAKKKGHMIKISKKSSINLSKIF